MIKNKKNQTDVRDTNGQSWLYTDTVKDHFFAPRNFLKHGEEKKFKFNAVGKVGSPACGDEMVIWLKIDPKKEVINDIRWRTFGCGSAIAATSILSEMIKKKKKITLEEALKITPADIMNELGGLPTRKVHCSVLGDKALEAAINDYFRKTKQHQRIIVTGTKIIDQENNITEKDIEEAVLEGIKTSNELIKKLNIAKLNKSSAIAIDELIHFYIEKYF